LFLQNVKSRRIVNENQPPSQIIDDQQTLALQIEALQAQLEEQTKLAKDQVCILQNTVYMFFQELLIC